MKNINRNRQSFTYRPVHIKEIKKAVFDMTINKAAWPDGFPMKVDQEFWEIVCTEWFSLFEVLCDNNLEDCSKLNYGVVTLSLYLKKLKIPSELLNLDQYTC